ncbi:MAG: leucine-rich repeat protein [Bacteroides sp.]|nr:leucine-rich repeat protein [Bacteroides sp.]
MGGIRFIFTALLGCLAATATAVTFKVTGELTPDSVSSLSARTDIDVLDLSEAVVTGTPSAGEIPAGAFFGSKIKSVSLPASTRRIREAAFALSALQSVEIPEGVVEIEAEAFYQCAALENIALPSSVRLIGKYAFAGCSALKELKLDHTRVTELPEGALAATQAMKHFSSTRLLKAGSHVFRGSGVEEVSLPSVRTLDEFALAGTPALKHVTLPNRVITGRGVLMDSPQLSRLDGALVDIPDLFAANSGAIRDGGGLQAAAHVGAYALANSPVSVITLAEGLRQVGAGVLSGCVNLTDIDARALGAAMPVADADAVAGTDPGKIRLIVAENTADLWKSDPVWGRFNVTTDISSLGIEQVAGADPAPREMRIVCAGGAVSVIAASYPVETAVYDADGRLHARATLYDAGQTLALDALPDGLLVVEARSGSASTALKLIK